MFILLMLAVYLIIAVSFLIKGKNWIGRLKRIPYNKAFQVAFVIAYIILACMPMIGLFKHFGGFKHVFLRIGNLWLGVFVLVGLFGAVAIIIRALQEKFGKKNYFTRHRPWQTVVMGILVIVIGFSLIGYGYYHAHQIDVKKYDIKCGTTAVKDENLKIAFISDLHIGGQVGIKDIENMVQKINAMKPDVVLIGGDIFDSDYAVIKNKKGIVDAFRKIKTRYGMYGVYGNHDVAEKLVGGFAVSSKEYAIRPPEMEFFIKQCGIVMLKDEVITIKDGEINLIGRLDQEKPGDGTSRKKSLKSLCREVDPTKPVILLEHEPVDLEEASKIGVDLVFAGHTHAGQIFPMTLTNNVFWDNGYGEKKFGGMYSIVSSGVGFYGPPLRIGSNGEVVEVNAGFIAK